jgi:hypothetical protein
MSAASIDTPSHTTEARSIHSSLGAPLKRSSMAGRCRVGSEETVSSSFASSQKARLSVVPSV